MSNINETILPERGVIAISGDDRKPFLQGLITNDINKATEKEAIFAALLSPQGKFLYDFFITQYQDQILLETDKSSISELIKRLQMYKLRSKVEITLLEEWAVMGNWEIGKLGNWGENDVIAYNDPRHLQLGKRILFPASRLPDFPTSSSYEAHRLTLGIPEGSKDLTKDKSLPMEWGYEQLGAIDFTKGCYVGQEVTARSKHRATLHKTICQIRSAQALPAKGIPLWQGGKEVGYVASSDNTIGLALLQKEAIAKGDVLTPDNLQVSTKLPDWLNRQM